MSFEFAQFEAKINKIFDHIKMELNSLRTGKANVQLLDSIRVEAYGSLMKLSEVASLSVPDHTLIMIKPWDRSLVGGIEKAIATAGINLSPVVDGEVVRVPVPALTQERREEMVKLLGQKIEAGKVMIRTARSETKQEIESAKGAVAVSEDDISRDLDNLEERVKTALGKVELISEQKKKELLTI